MEHIGDILRRERTQINISRANTDTSSSAEETVEAPPELSCPVCYGAGFVHPRLPSGQPDFSRVVPCRCAREEMEKTRQAQLQEFSNLGSLARVTFDKLPPQGRSSQPHNQERFRKAYEAAKAFASQPKGWLVLVGPPGSGKTPMAAAIVNESLRQGHGGFYVTTPDLLDHLRSAFSPDSEMTYDEMFERVRRTPLLVLDDFDIQTSTAWAKEKLEQLLNYRFNNELPTVIVSSSPVERLDERIGSRLADPRLCRVLVIEEKEAVLQDYNPWPDFLKRMTFENFDWRRPNLTPEQRDNLERAYRAALDFAKTLDGWLVFQGGNGCGKTHLTAAIGNECLKAGGQVMFVEVPDFLDYLRSTFSPDSKVTYDQLFEMVKKVPLLMLDDFGEQSATSWAQEKLYQVINYRYNNRLATVITTSYALDEVESRVSSRLADGRLGLVMGIIAPDYRSDQRLAPNRRTYRRKER
ncbi:MAG: ATP-binding protein [Chloroflexi bacterium]|nr:ATP-binding protein [Chloroflexota bacterium]